MALVAEFEACSPGCGGHLCRAAASLAAVAATVEACIFRDCGVALQGAIAAAATSPSLTWIAAEMSETPHDRPGVPDEVARVVAETPTTPLLWSTATAGTAACLDC